tara:strand:- start:60 stop:461 length:402 start_codon:yes stop_codon:yes gene_type:complete
VIKRASRRAARLLWGGTGLVLFALGFLGIFLPLLPTTPLWIGAVICFSKSSPALETWILNHPRFGQAVLDYRDHSVIARRAKRAALSAILVSAVITNLVVELPLARLGASTILLLVAGFIASRPEHAQSPGGS